MSSAWSAPSSSCRCPWRAREMLGLDGMDVETALNVRDKSYEVGAPGRWCALCPAPTGHAP